MENLKQLLFVLPKKFRFKFLILIFSSLISLFCEMVGISLIIPIFSSLSGDSNILENLLNKLNLKIDTDLISGTKILYIFGAVFLTKILIVVFNTYYQNKTIFSYFSYLVNRLYKYYILKDINFHTSNNSAELIRNLMLNTHNLAVGYLGAILNIIIEIILIIGICFLIFLLQNSLILVSIFTILIIAILIILSIKNKIKNFGKKREDLVFLDMKYLMESMGAIKDIKIYNKEKEVIELYQGNINKLCNLNATINVLNALPKQILEFFVIISVILILIIFINLSYSLVEIISYMSILVIGFIRIVPSSSKLVVAFFNLSFYKKSVETIFNDYKDSSDNYDLNKIGNKEIDKKLLFNKDIIFKNLNFSYLEKNEKKEIFQDMNIEIKKGEMIGIYGETGSGKSTFIDLIAGFIKPESGSIIIDEKKTSIFEDRRWRSKIGYVPQSVFLKDDTIAENIFFYENDNNKKSSKLVETIKLSKLEKFVASLKDGIDTQIGEKGSRISGGQRQRIGIARALYKECEILIFDEATNALDPETESSLMHNINQLKGKKTVLIITHKYENLKNCDKIFKIENKKLRKINLS